MYTYIYILIYTHIYTDIYTHIYTHLGSSASEHSAHMRTIFKNEKTKEQMGVIWGKQNKRSSEQGEEAQLLTL